ncbi:MAG: SDR family NAD(P)-dependent oxidoreductase [Spirochaetes bacterium]|nr:MAG: SDR family NAD(P)-dependent oxidoreductase [Spirochaetota bacterium]
MSKKIIITGASGGFGRLTTSTLLRKGHTVIAAMRDPSGKNKGVADTLTREGARVVEIDVTDDSSVVNGMENALEWSGGIDVVVNNAGVGVLGFQETFTSKDWKRLFDINVFGVQRVNRAILPHMRARHAGLLIHISSLLGRMVLPYFGAYCASKAALEALADAYRIELSSWGIESVIVEPGAYGTGFEKHLMRPSDEERRKDYGAMADDPERRIESFGKMFEGPQAPNPQWVADAVAGLVDMPRGERPFRTTVDRLGMGQAIEPYNKSIEEIQRHIYSAFGMGELLKLSA